MATRARYGTSAMGSGVKGRGARSGALIALLGLVAALAFAEGLARSLPGAHQSAFPRGVVRYDARLGWALRPGATGRHQSPYFDVTYSIDPTGAREGPAAQPGRRFRVAFYGDSFVFGWGVSLDDRFVEHLETLHPQIDGVGLGVPGYGLDQQYLAYEASERHSSAAVFLISDATLGRLDKRRLFGMPKPVFEREAAGWRQRSPRRSELHWIYSMPDSLALPELLARRFARVITETADAAPAPLIIARHLLRRLRALTCGRRERLILLVQVSASSWRSMEPLLRPRQDTVVRLSVPSGEEERLILGRNDRHWSAAGHQQVAESLAAPLAAALEAPPLATCPDDG